MLTRRSLILSLPLAMASGTALAQSGDHGTGQSFQIPSDMRSRVVDVKPEYDAGELHLYRDTNNLYYTLGDGKAVAYKVGLGQLGMQWDGTLTVGRKAEWPSWTPTQDMIERDPELYAPYADGMDGGPDNPLGARALYLYKDGRDTLYRLHGTPQPWTVGQNTSNGCVRLYNSDIIDLFNRVPVGTKIYAH